MDPSIFPQVNLDLEKPQGWEDEECRSLPVWRGLTDDKKHQQFVSCWLPTPEELVDLSAGKPIWLHVISASHPPVMLTTQDPFAVQDLPAGEGAQVYPPTVPPTETNPNGDKNSLGKPGFKGDRHGP